MTELPIDASLPRIIEALRRASPGVVAPPGSGKTTRVPPAILRVGPALGRASGRDRAPAAARGGAGRGGEDRRRAGLDAGRRGRLPGPLRTAVLAETRLRFLTEGILTRQLLADPFLESVGAVILDEFHERNLNSDLALALLREVRREVRPDLILVVMSATLDAEPVARFLDDCPIVRSKGEPSGIRWNTGRSTGRRAPRRSFRCIEELVVDPRDSGHLLVFLPGLAEIRAGARNGSSRPRTAPVPWCCRFTDRLPAEEQDRALRPSDRRKIILSTNVAETSLTIDGVTTVIDSGLARIVRYDAERGIDRWELGRISRAAADQRAGRAGRTGPGRCIRLWSERDQRGRPEFEQPEIHRVDLCAHRARLARLGRRRPRSIRLV